MRRFTGWEGYAVALLAVAAATVVIGLIEERWHLANISMLYLIAVLATATAFGSGPAVLAAVAAFLAFDWFFVDPRHTLTVSDPEEWVALLLFLATAVITGQMAAGQRRRAQEARAREREAVVLYDAVRLMNDGNSESTLHAVAELLRRELGLAGVVVEIRAGKGNAPTRAASGTPEALRLVDSSASRSSRALGQASPPGDGRSGPVGRWVRIVPPQPPGQSRLTPSGLLHVVPIERRGARIGTIALVREPGSPAFREPDNRLLLAVAAQLGLAVERDRLRQEATEAEILRRTDELKSALLNAVSHDLRTPLASIIASAGSLRQRDVEWTEQDQQEFAEAIELEARRLNRIVGNLLDLSRIEAGSLRPAWDWYDVGALVDDVLGRLRPSTSGHPVSVTIPDDLPPVRLDYVEIDQVLSNLVENATKYTPAGGEISIVVRRTDGEVEISVEDQGPGIPPALLSRVFDPFYRIEGDGHRPRGTGLGLAVAKGLVEAHGGRMWAENRPTGGARFVFTLPLAEQERAPTPTAQGAA